MVSSRLDSRNDSANFYFSDLVLDFVYMPSPANPPSQTAFFELEKQTQEKRSSMSPCNDLQKVKRANMSRDSGSDCALTRHKKHRRVDLASQVTRGVNSGDETAIICLDSDDDEATHEASAAAPVNELLDANNLSEEAPGKHQNLSSVGISGNELEACFSTEENLHQEAQPPGFKHLLQIQLAKINKERYKTNKTHEDTVVQLELSRDKEMAQIWQKYGLLLQEAENDARQKRKELDLCYEKTKAQMLLAKAWTMEVDVNSLIFHPSTHAQSTGMAMANSCAELINQCTESTDVQASPLTETVDVVPKPSPDRCEHQSVPRSTDAAANTTQSPARAQDDIENGPSQNPPTRDLPARERTTPPGPSQSTSVDQAILPETTVATTSVTVTPAPDSSTQSAEHDPPPRLRPNRMDLSKLKKLHATLQCRGSPKTFAQTIERLTLDQHEALRCYGFECFLYWKIKSNPTSLAHWVVQHFDPVTLSIVKDRSKIVQLSATHVHICMGLPQGRTKLNPSNITHSRKQCCEFRLQFEDTKATVTPASLSRHILQNKSESGPKFIRNMMLLFNNTVMGDCSANGALNMGLLPILQNVNDIRQYNWCEYLLNRLVDARNNWSPRGSNRFRGPVLYLILAYLDRFAAKDASLDPPKRLYPIVKGWTTNMVTAREKEDLEVGFGEGVLREPAKFDEVQLDAGEPDQGSGGMSSSMHY